MCRQRRRLGLLGVIVGCLGLAGAALADVTTEHSGSILVFPKVIANGTRDTIIQLTNTSNSVVRAHCFYVNGALRDPTQPPGPLNPPLWQEVDFTITLTRQQPTHWKVSRGRFVNPFDPLCGPGKGVCIGGASPGDVCDTILDCEPGGLCSNTGCTDTGFDPGLIPPVVPGFTGELKCVEVDDSGAPLAGNHLKGEATLVSVLTGDLSKYNGIAILGTENNGDGTLVLGGGQCVGAGAFQGAVCRSDAECAESAPCAVEYNACPRAWVVNHLADGAPNLAVEQRIVVVDARAGRSAGDQVFPLQLSSVFTQLTIVPCTQNFETQEPSRVTLQFLTTNEFESQFSVSTTVDCWGNFFLSEVGATALTFAGTVVADPQGTMFLKTRIRSASGTPQGVLVVAEELHHVFAHARRLTDGSEPLDLNSLFGSPFSAAAAVNVHMEGEQSNPDVVTIPAEQLAP